MSTEQTPTNNESLLVAHIPFDLDWAKIGAPVVFMGKYGDKLVTYYNVIIPQPPDMEPSHPFIDLTIEFNSVSTSLLRLSPTDLRMATRAECESAGVEYIEKPVSAEELAELRKDRQRLDWVLRNKVLPYSYNKGFECWSRHGIKRGATPREAIDAAMKGGE